MSDDVPVLSPVSSALEPRRRFGCAHLVLAAGIATALTAIAAVLIVRFWLLPPPFKPVRLNGAEARVLQAKLDRLDFPRRVSESVQAPTAPTQTADEPIVPEPYSEADADRTIRFTERELNALLAENTDLANQLAIDLSPDLVSAKLRIPLDPDFPVLGGKVLKVKAGVGFRYENGRPVVLLRGVTVMGVPLPNAWLGGLKNIDLIQEFGGNEGFWKAFADGVEHLHVEADQLVLQLKE
jgi:hypothetical protein